MFSEYLHCLRRSSFFSKRLLTIKTCFQKRNNFITSGLTLHSHKLPLQKLLYLILQAPNFLPQTERPLLALNVRTSHQTDRYVAMAIMLHALPTKFLDFYIQV
jgi:hypothetical protein